MNMTLKEVSALTEDQARETLEAIRWRDGVFCPHCGEAEKVGKLGGASHRPGLWKCYGKGCRKQFSVMVGTIFHRSHIPLRTWLMAFAIMCSSKKGVSALQLQRQLGLGSYQSAWHMAHRIRHAMSREPLASLLSGDVEVDETYVGGKPRKGAGEPSKRGRGTKKTPVVALVERGGRVRVRKVANVTGKTLKAAIRENVDKSSAIMTDEYSAYHGIGKEFAGGHHVVNHGRGEYVSGRGSTNTAESFFALLKRGIMGSFHSVSKQHLDRYCEEFGFRWDHRNVSDSERTEEALRSAEGKRLTYKQPLSR